MTLESETLCMCVLIQKGSQRFFYQTYNLLLL